MKLKIISTVLLSVFLILSASACGSTSTSTTTPTSTSSYGQQCASGCENSYLNDGHCDSACNNAPCNWDDGDCNQCAAGCENSYLNNGHCDYVCNNYACDYDGGDCPIPTSALTGYPCPCGNLSDELIAEECVWSYLLGDAATTSDGRQVQAAVADAFKSGALHGECIHFPDGSWPVNTYFDILTIEDKPLLNDIFSQTSICGPSNRESYNTEWSITSAGCVHGVDGNAMRLLTELQNQEKSVVSLTRIAVMVLRKHSYLLTSPPSQCTAQSPLW